MKEFIPENLSLIHISKKQKPVLYLYYFRKIRKSFLICKFDNACGNVNSSQFVEICAELCLIKFTCVFTAWCGVKSTLSCCLKGLMKSRQA